MNRFLTRLGVMALLALGMAQSLGASPAAPVAGTTIPNRASATWTDSSGRVLTLQSNEVQVLVQPLEALALTQDQVLQRPPGASFAFAHRLVNTGNVRTRYDVSFQNLGGDDFELAGLAVGQGRLRLAVDLEPGASADLLLTGTVPASAAPGSRARVEITARSTGQGDLASNTDEVQVVDGAALSLTKTASRATAAPGDEVEFSLRLTNLGGREALGSPYTVDGAPRDLVLLADPVPANTVLVEATGEGSGQVLHHLLGAPQDDWRSGVPADPARVDQVAWGMPSVPAGFSAALRLRVRLAANAAGTVRNVASVRFLDPVSGAPSSHDSNPVFVQTGTAGPRIGYFDPTWSHQTAASRTGRPLYVQVDSATCNGDPGRVETIEVSLRSRLTGDLEAFTATETGPNTGVFRIVPAVPTADGRAGPGPGDGTLQTVEQDVLIAREECSGFQVEADILIDPFGVVFDSRTDQPVAGATVTLYDVTGGANGGNAGGPARVFDDDGVTPAPSTVVTGADGSFRFPLVGPSTYRLGVQPPTGYGFPSAVPPLQLPPGRTIEPAGSYGGNFQVTQATGSVKLDVPLDGGGSTSGLFLEKTANRQVVELGEFLEYTVAVSNGTGGALTRVNVGDDLPAGFEYVSGTARLDGGPLADPSGAPGPHLEFDLGAMAVGARATLVYRVRVGPGTTLGDRTNRAQAAASALGGTVFSNTASAKVRVEPGVFPDRGVLIGKVFVDLDGDRRPDPGEPGIPMVRLLLEDGTFVVTDREGKYNLYGLRARTHVLRVDGSTLPAGAVLGTVSQRNAGDPWSMFVDLKKGELFRADFAEISGSQAVLDEVERRRKSDGPLEGGALLEDRLDPTAVQPDRPDPRALPSAGMIGPSGPIPMEATPPRGDLLDDRNSNLPEKPVSPAPPSVDSVASLSNEAGFVDLQEGDTLATPQGNVRVKGLLGTTLRLLLNGEVVPENRVGTRSTVEASQLQVWEYIGVDFRPGENELVLEQVDPYGNVRETVRRKVLAPGAAGALKLVGPEQAPPADGRTPVRIEVLVTDERGLPVSARTAVTLQADAGRWDVADGNPREPGVQVFVSGGRGEFPLLPPVEPGTVRVQASSGLMQTRLDVVFTTELRPLIVTGLVEGGVDFRRTTGGPVRPDRVGNLVEDELDRLGRTDDAASRADVRGSFYMKGDLGNGYGITMAYDSQKEKDLRLFRDLQPDQYFPIYGDASVKGFDAVSTSPFYMRVDRERNYLLYGDFVTATPDAHQGLGTYYRSLTGGKLHLEGDGYRVNVFGTRDRQRQVVQEIPANGTSGPYPLNYRYPRVNSERVELVTRDRNQPSVVLQSQAMSRFTDYVVDFSTGGILFRRPVQSLDANLNPIYVRVTYEVDGGGPAAWVYGGDARFRVADGVTVGGTYASEDQAQDPYRLWSANLGLDLSENTRFTAEVAGSHRLSLGSGTANRFELVHDGGPIRGRVFVGRTDPTFDNPTSILARGRSESGLKGTWTVDEDTRLMGEAIRSRDTTTGAELSGYQVGVERRLAEGLSLEVAYRRAIQKNGPAQPALVGVGNLDLSTVRARLSGQIPGAPEATAFLEYEQDVRDASKRALTVGGDYQFADRARVYARHEVISTLGGRYTMNEIQRNHQTVVGVDADYMDGGHVYSEYRVRDAISGRENEAAIGLRNSFEVAEGLRLNTSLERLLAAPTGQDGMAVTGALEYTGSPDFKGTARLEYRNQGGQSYLLRTVGAAWRASEDFSVLLRDVSDRSQGGTGSRAFERTQLGLAWRPRDGGPWNALARLERRFERDDLASQLRRNVALLSLAVNYQADGPLRVSAYYAGKLADEESSGIRSTTGAHMVGGRLVWELSQRWDIGLTGAKFFGSADQGDQHTLGLESGYMLRQDLWLSAGYNFVGFDDQDFSLENYTSQGPYVRLRFKFGTDEFGEEAVTP